MKAALRISIWLNLGLLGGLIFVLANQRKEGAASASGSSETKPLVQAATTPAPPAPSRMEPEPFRWGQLVSTKDYRIYVANLRTIGCPEPTVQDIVRGDTGRAFSSERSQLGLDESGVGPWSRQAEMQLVASLLRERPPAAETTALAQDAVNRTEVSSGGNEVVETTALTQSAAHRAPGNSGNEVAENSVPSQTAGAAASAYPLFLQNVNWGALGFDAGQQAAIAQVRQQYLNEINGPNQNLNNSANQSPNSPSQNATPTNPNPDDKLRELLGTQGYQNYMQQQYFVWYQPQVQAAEGGQLTINPGAFSVK
jgi:hypothetical protein